MTGDCMSLVDISKEPYIRLVKTKQPDGRGGSKYVWADGEEIQAAVVFNNSPEARLGQTLGVTSMFTVTTTKDVDLRYHEVIRNKENGDVFRITSDGKYNKTPKTAGLNMKQVQAEKWSLTEDDKDG